MRTHAISLALVAALLVVIAPSAEAGRGTASLKYLADKTDAVVIVDVAKGRKSVVFRTGFAVASDEVSRSMPLLATVQIDKIDTVIAGHVSSTEMVLVLEGKVDGLLADAKKRSTASGKHGGIPYWTTPEVDVALIDRRLVIATAGTIGAVITRAADPKRSRGPVRVATWLAAAQGSPVIVVAGLPDARLRKDLTKRLGASPQFATVSIGTASNLTLDLRAPFGDAAAAASAVAALSKVVSSGTKDRLEAFVGKDFADSIQIDQDLGTMRASAVMTADEVDKVIGVRMLM